MVSCLFIVLLRIIVWWSLLLLLVFYCIIVYPSLVFVLSLQAVTCGSIFALGYTIVCISKWLCLSSLAVLLPPPPFLIYTEKYGHHLLWLHSHPLQCALELIFGLRFKMSFLLLL